MVAQRRHPIRQEVVISRDHAPLSGGDDLSGMKGEPRRFTHGSSRYAVSAGSDSTCSILNYEHVLWNHFSNSRHIGTQAEEMDGYHGPGSVGNTFRNRLGVDVEGVPLDIGKDRDSAAMFHHVRRGNPGKGWNDYLVTRADTHGDQSCMKRRRATGHCDGAFDIVHLCEQSLKLRDPGTLGQPPGFNGRPDGFNFLCSEDGTCNGDLPAASGNVIHCTAHSSR